MTWAYKTGEYIGFGIRRVAKLFFGVIMSLALSLMAALLAFAFISLGTVLVTVLALFAMLVLVILPWLTFFGLGEASEHLTTKLAALKTGAAEAASNIHPLKPKK